MKASELMIAAVIVVFVAALGIGALARALRGVARPRVSTAITRP